MSEYIEIESETTADPDVLRLVTNLSLATDGEERYETIDAMEEGSPVAQVLAYVPGIACLTLTEREMIVTRTPDMPWHIIVAEINAAVKDFFL